MDCWNKGQCGKNGPNGRDGQGPCDFCGPEGYCCRKENNNYWRKTNGCDGTIGGESGHRCAAKHGISFIIFLTLSIKTIHSSKILRTSPRNLNFKVARL